MYIYIYRWFIVDEHVLREKFLFGGLVYDSCLSTGNTYLSYTIIFYKNFNNLNNYVILFIYLLVFNQTLINLNQGVVKHYNMIYIFLTGIFI